MHLYQDPLWREGSVNALQCLQFIFFQKVQVQRGEHLFGSLVFSSLIALSV